MRRRRLLGPSPSPAPRGQQSESVALTPDAPTVAEKGIPGFSAGSWFGFFAPKGTPAAAIAVVNKAVNDALPSLEAQLIREGADPVDGSAAQFGQFTQQEYEKWRSIIRDSGATVDYTTGAREAFAMYGGGSRPQRGLDDF